jgi:drug/metabolite transporter (DMT)-like permease
MSLKASLGLWIACFLWAISFIATKVALEGAPPLSLVALRLLISAGCFALWFWSRGRGIPWPGRGTMGKLFVLSLLGTGLHYGIQTIGLRYTTASNASIYAVTGPISITVIAALWLGERLTARKAIGISIALAGVFWVMGWESLREFNLEGHLLGDVLVFGSIMLWAGFTVYGKSLMEERGAMEVIGLTTIIGAVWMIPVAFVEMVALGFSPLGISWEAWAAIGFLGVTCSFMATLLYFMALHATESQKVAVYLYTIPPMTYLVAALYLGEHIGLNLIGGSLLILAGVYLTERG